MSVDDQNQQFSQPLITHLLELRDRLLRIIAIVILLFLSLVYFANDIYQYLAIPLLVSFRRGQA